MLHTTENRSLQFLEAQLKIETMLFDNLNVSMLDQLSDQDLDLLEFGVVAMDIEGKVLAYNTTESRYSGLSPDRVLGRHFFTQVAPCTNNQIVAKRFNEQEFDVTIDYTFALRMKPIPVKLRMIRGADLKRMYLLVEWR